MADWAMVAELGTAVGTLVLAVATFASVRSSNRSARADELSTQQAMRPLLLPSRTDDLEDKVGFADDHWLHVPGGRAAVEATDDAVYIAVSVRNIGSGLAVLSAWQLLPERFTGPVDRPDPDAFRRLTLDLYVAPEAPGYFEGALREPEDDLFVRSAKAIRAREPITLDVLYGDGDGGQRVISRFLLSPIGEDDVWLPRAIHHWNLDRADPR